MGSTSVSEVTGIMSVGQGSQTLTGTKEGDLKVQFAEVMSQMTTQVGYGYSYGGQNGKHDTSDSHCDCLAGNVINAGK